MDTPHWQTRVLRWLFLDLDSFFASVEQQCDPSLRHRPVAVLPVLSQSTCVIAASYEAKKFGIKTGTPVREAKARCPDIVFRTGAFERYVDFHDRVIAAIEEVIPVTDVCSIDEVACSLDPSQQNEATAVALAYTIKQTIKARVGPCIGSSIGVASSRLLAKVGSGLQKPNGLVMLGPEVEKVDALIGHLPVTKLTGIADAMGRRLARGGIGSVSQLMNLAPKHARMLWGSVQGERFWYALQGYDILPEGTSRSSVSHSQVLGWDMRPISEARLVGRRLLQKAAARLRRMGYTATGLGVSMRGDQGHAHWHGDTSFASTQSSFDFLHAYEQLWQDGESYLGSTARLKKVGVWLSGLQPISARQLDIFNTSQDEAHTQRSEKLSHIMDGLNQKFGRDTVLLGQAPKQVAQYTGTKIAFTRIPTKEEFLS
jgi:DNA polymerase-4